MTTTRVGSTKIYTEIQFQFDIENFSPLPSLRQKVRQVSTMGMTWQQIFLVEERNEQFPPVVLLMPQRCNFVKEVSLF